MKTLLRWSGYVSLLWLSMTVAGAVVVAANPGEPRIKVLKAPPPEYPAALLNEPVYRGFALVGCTVAADGSVVEAWTLRASHRAFADAAEKAMREPVSTRQVAKIESDPAGWPPTPSMLRAAPKNRLGG